MLRFHVPDLNNIYNNTCDSRARQRWPFKYYNTPRKGGGTHRAPTRPPAFPSNKNYATSSLPLHPIQKFPHPSFACAFNQRLSDPDNCVVAVTVSASTIVTAGPACVQGGKRKGDGVKKPSTSTPFTKIQKQTPPSRPRTRLVVIVVNTIALRRVLRVVAVHPRATSPARKGPRTGATDRNSLGDRFKANPGAADHVRLARRRRAETGRVPGRPIKVAVRLVVIVRVQIGATQPPRRLHSSSVWWRLWATASGWWSKRVASPRFSPRPRT